MNEREKARQELATYLLSEAPIIKTVEKLLDAYVIATILYLAALVPK